MAGRKSDFTLTRLDDLFSTQEQRDEEKLSKIRDIPLELIDDFPDHPFKVRDDEDMQQLVESIKERGVITPATVRQKEDGRYELVSGHRRKRASELVGNYDKEYLSGISEKLDDYSMKYRELYTQCYEEISGYSSTSIQSSLLKGLSKTTKAVGKIVERIPVVGDTQADETLIAAGEKLGDIGTEKIRKQMSQLIERQSNFVRPFIDNIDTVNRLNNNPVQLLVDKDNLYIATIA